MLAHYWAYQGTTSVHIQATSYDDAISRLKTWLELGYDLAMSLENPFKQFDERFPNGLRDGADLLPPRQTGKQMDEQNIIWLDGLHEEVWHDTDE